MGVKFDLTGTTRKALVQGIIEICKFEARYMKMPTCAYMVRDYTITKDGYLVWDEITPDTDAETLIAALIQLGFKPENYALAQREEPDTDEYCDTLCIELSRESLSEAELANFDQIIQAKGNLLRKALGVDCLIYELTEDKVRFPRFRLTGDADEATAYMQLIGALAEMACKSKCITAKEKDVANEKYAFRCFLLRLGFIGKEYKAPGIFC